MASVSSAEHSSSQLRSTPLDNRIAERFRGGDDVIPDHVEAQRRESKRSRLEHVVTLTERLAMVVAVAFLIALIVILVADGIARNVFSTGRVGSAEWMGMIFCGMMCASLPLNVSRGPHIEVDVLHRLVPQPIKRAMDLVRASAMVMAFIFLLPHATRWARDSIAIRESRFGIVDVLIYPFKAGFVVAVACCSLIAIHQLIRLLRSDAAQTDRA